MRRKGIGHVFLFFSIVIVIIIALIIAVRFSNTFEKLNIDNVEKICGDGTFYGNCSLRKPYFCENGTLVEKAEVCDCPELFQLRDNACVSDISTGKRNLTLPYIILGERKNLSLVFYDGVASHLSSLPRFVRYDNGEPSRRDLELRTIDEPSQRKFLLDLATEIQNIAPNSKVDQARIAISVVQNIPWGASNKTIRFLDKEAEYSRYPYEVLSDNEGLCGEKSELLAFLLKEIGYGVVTFYFSEENHEAVGIKCPVEMSLEKSGYCFVETSGPAIITDSSIDYINGVTLSSSPEIIFISDGDSLGKNLPEYRDAKDFNDIRKRGFLGFVKLWRLGNIKERYGLQDEFYQLS